MATPWFIKEDYLQSKLSQLIASGDNSYTNTVQVEAAIEAAGYTALSHFETYGSLERTSPNQYFDAAEYLEAKAAESNSTPEGVALAINDAGLSIWQHFQQYGWTEGVSPSNSFDVDAYLADKLAQLQADEPGAGWTAQMLEDTLEAAGLDPISHYYTYGQAEGLVPEPILTAEDFTLTTGTDLFTGNDASDTTFTAPLETAIDGLVGAQTLQSVDVLDGGEGDNVLNAELNGTGIGANPKISNIQTYNLTSTSILPIIPGLTGFLDLDRATGYEVLNNVNSRFDLELYNVGEVAALGMDNVRDGSVYRVGYDNIPVDTQVVTVNNSGAAGGSGNRVKLNITGVQGGITNLELNVSNGVYLNLRNDAAHMENLTISGSGVLDLIGQHQFDVLQTLDATGYNEDLILDISGSGTLTSVLTGDGDDQITAAAANFSADTPATTLDLGDGNNRLILEDTFDTQSGGGTYTGGGVIDSDELSALDFTFGPVSNVQTLELVDVDLDGNASLALNGVGGLETLEFRDFDTDGSSNLLISGGPEVLTINGTTDGNPNDADFEMGASEVLTVNDTVNLTMNAGDDLFLRGGLEGNALETVVLNAGDDLRLNASQGLDKLTSIEANALNTSPNTGGSSNARVDLNLTTASDLGALKTVNVTGATDATLNMTGIAGVAYFAGTQATQSFTIDVTAGPGGYSRTSAGNAFFTSSDLITTSGFIDTNYSTTLSFWPGANNPGFDWGAATDIANALDATAELEATSAWNSKVVNVTWADVGSGKDALVFQPWPHSDATVGSLDGVADNGFTDGQDEILQVDGEGFDALETVTVDAKDGDASVDLEDVSGAFTLAVNATDDADVWLTNTNVTSATIAAGTDLGDAAYVDVGGDTIGARSLVDLTVSGDEADIYLEDDLSSFQVLDVRDVLTDLDVTTTWADFGPRALGTYVEYKIGATADVDFDANDAREVFNFSDGTVSDIGNVVIHDFTAGADPLLGDRLDLSDYANGAGQLVFNDDGTDTVITDLAGLGLGDFGGSITLAGVTGVDVGLYNVIYG